MRRRASPQVGPRIGTVLAVALLLAAAPARAHGPIFSAGPHVVFKGGVEAGIEYRRQRAAGAGGEDTEHELTLELDYGLTADWQVGIEIPYTAKDDDGRDEDGLGDVVLGTKYRFLRLDSPGLQRSTALILEVKLPTGDDATDPRLGSGSTDFIGGFTAGYEGRRWYAFADARYRLNGEGEGALEKGDRQFLDLVGGVRPVLTGYLEPDTVLLLELNLENAERDRRGGLALADTGGWELFVAPGIFWTWRNFAVRGAVQIPIAANLNGVQSESDYRLKVGLEWHL